MHYSMNSFISFKKQPSVCVLHIIEVRLSLFLTHPYTSFCFPLNSCKKFNSESCDEIDLAQIEIPICTSQFIMRLFRRFRIFFFYYLSVTWSFTWYFLLTLLILYSISLGGLVLLSSCCIPYSISTLLVLTTFDSKKTLHGF